MGCRMYFKYKSLSKEIDIQFIYIVYACLIGDDKPISPDRVLDLARDRELIDKQSMITFICRWFNRLDDKSMRERGDDILSKLFTLDYRALLTYISSSPIMLGVACGQWERSQLPGRTMVKGSALDWWLDSALCEHILYPLDHKNPIDEWYLKFYIDIAVYYPHPSINKREILRVARDRNKEIESTSLLKSIADTGFLITEDGSNYIWIDRKIPLRLRGIPSILSYWYRTDRLVKTSLSRE